MEENQATTLPEQNLNSSENENNAIESQNSGFDYAKAYSLNEEESNYSENSEEKAYTSEWLMQNTNIHGWLSFFLFIIGLGAVISLITSIVEFTKYSDPIYDYFTVGDIFQALIMLGIASYTIYAFAKRKPNALFYARAYILIVLYINIFVFILTALFNPYADSDITISLIRSFVWAIIWIAFLSLSKQVETVIPKPFRAVKKTDWLIVAGVIVVPLLYYLLGGVYIV